MPFHKTLLSLGATALAGPGAGAATRLLLNGGGNGDLIERKRVKFAGIREKEAARGVVPRTETARISQTTIAERAVGTALKFGGEILGGGGGTTMVEKRLVNVGGKKRGIIDDSACPSGTIPDPRGSDFCVSPESAFGQGRGARFVGVGDAVMGRYGAALEPGVMVVNRSICLRGMQLGDDGLCYNKGQISNKQRLWPKGRRPLLSGGDMRAISIAARAGKRLEGATKRLQGIGLMKKPGAHRRALPAHQHAKQIAAVSV